MMIELTPKELSAIISCMQFSEFKGFKEYLRGKFELRNSYLNAIAMLMFYETESEIVRK